jgi:UDP:flavonoid glycosyltransferase YjiC (YdhE family)
VPDNIFVERYAPGDALLAVSDVVISHGGNGTIYQALEAGVPIIGFPGIFDQEINMQRVEALGAGLSLWRARYGKSTLLSAVERVLGDAQFQERCRFLGKRCREMAGGRRAAAWVHSQVRGGRRVGAHQPRALANAPTRLAQSP